MATPSRRPGRPGAGRPGAARRAAPAPREYAEGEEPLEGEEDLEEAPPPRGPPVATMIGLGAAVLVSILIAMAVFGGRGFAIEVENTSENPLQKVVVKINGTPYRIGDLRPNEVGGARASRSPGREVVVEYDVPLRGRFTRTLPKKSEDGFDAAPEFNEYTGAFRIRLAPEGITATVY